MFLFDLVPWLICGPPVLLLLMAFVPRSLASRHSTLLVQSAGVLTSLSFGTSLFSCLWLLKHGTIQHRFVEIGPLNLGIYFDVLSATFLLLISFLGAVIARYSRHYMAGDAGIGRFFKWLCATTGSALVLVIAGNLVMFTLAWMAMSLNLHKLLTFYPERPAALLAARKKFVISRLGDSCLLVVIWLTYRLIGSWDFDQIFAAANRIRLEGVGGQSATLTAIALLLVTGAMLKSAQFPFHSWLPDTMETPTPVSALMHAGIINAGGILIVRLSPLVALSPVALNALALFGAFTALFAVVVMTTQTSVKRSLAFSTVAQMGFMMLQCGLGAFSVAVLHIVGHSLYKAFAFLSSGSTISASTKYPEPIKTTPSPLVSLGALGMALVAMLGTAYLGQVSFQAEAGSLLLSAVLLLALAHYLRTLWMTQFSPFLLLVGGTTATGISALYFGLHQLLHIWLYPVLPPTTALHGGLEVGFLLVVAFICALWMVGPWLLRSSRLQDWRRALYVHAANGFYINTLTNTLAQRALARR